MGCTYIGGECGGAGHDCVAVLSGTVAAGVLERGLKWEGLGSSEKQPFLFLSSQGPSPSRCNDAYLPRVWQPRLPLALTLSIAEGQCDSVQLRPIMASSTCSASLLFPDRPPFFRGSLNDDSHQARL